MTPCCPVSPASPLTRGTPALELALSPLNTGLFLVSFPAKTICACEKLYIERAKRLVCYTFSYFDRQYASTHSLTVRERGVIHYILRDFGQMEIVIQFIIPVPLGLDEYKWHFTSTHLELHAGRSPVFSLTLINTVTL